MFSHLAQVALAQAAAQAPDAGGTPDGLVRLYVILGYFALLLALGGVATSFLRKGKEDYMLASHSIGPFLLLMSLFGTTMTAFAMVGSSGEAFADGIGVYGMLASSSGIIHSLCFFVIGVKIWKFGRLYGYTTQIQFFRDRLESRTIGIFLFPILVGLLIPYLLGGVIASGTVIQALTSGAFPEIFPSANKALAGGIPPYLGSLMVCFVVLAYVFFGGMRGTAWANTFQTIVFMVLGVVTFYTIAMQVGQGTDLFDSMSKAIAKVDVEHTTRKGMSQTAFLTYMFIPLSVGMFPHLFQHWLTAKSAGSFKLAVVCHPFFIMLVWVPCVMIGIWASAPGVVPPTWQAAPDEFQNKVLGFLVTKHTTPIMGGLLASGILAAVMSSLDSQFLCVGTIFTTDIYDRFFKKPAVAGEAEAKGDTSVWVARAFILAVVALTYVISLYAEDKSVFSLSIWCFSGYAALFPLIFAALYWRGLSKAGAISSVIAMAVAWSYFFYASGFGRGTEIAEGKYEAYKLTVPGTEWEVMPVVPIIAITTVVMLLVSLITPKPSEKTIKRFFS